MNKKILTLLLGATLLCGCRTRYQITTTNGSEYTAIGRPKRVAGHYVFKDINGKEVQLSAMRVVSIEARSPWEKSREPFTGAPKK